MKDNHENLEEVEAVQSEEGSTEKSEKYSNRKSFAFSDEQMFHEVDEILKQKPEGLTNTEFLHQALKSYIENEELEQTFNQLPLSVVDVFKGDLVKLEVAFEMIQEVFKTQMTSTTHLIQQREDKITRQFDRERETLTQRVNQLTQEFQVVHQQLGEAQALIKGMEPLKQDLQQSKGTVVTLQQALISEQERVAGLQRELSRCNVEEYETLKKAHAELKELFATNNIRMQHLESQLTQQEELLSREREQAQQQKAIFTSEEQTLKADLKATREELAEANKSIQELYQKLLKA